MRRLSHICHDALNERVAVQLFRVNNFAVDNAAFSKRLAYRCRVNIRKIVRLGSRLCVRLEHIGFRRRRLALCVRLEHILLRCRRFTYKRDSIRPAAFQCRDFLRRQVAVLPDQRADLVIDLTPRQHDLIVPAVCIGSRKGNAFAIVAFIITDTTAAADPIFVFQKFNALFLRMTLVVKVVNALFASLYIAATGQ